MGVLFQFFEYDIHFNDQLWRIIPFELDRLSSYGITAVWLPPAYKGSSGRMDVGYGPYDLYDLGEFDQKWTIPTKYGYKDQYLEAIEACHKHHIKVYGDIVLNHKMGSDGVNYVKATTVDSSSRNKKKGKSKYIEAPTQFNFDNRQNKYSAFKWTADHFTGVDYDFKSQKNAIYLLDKKKWSKRVDKENGNYDFLLGSNIDHNYPDVREELIRWGRWYKQISHIDGFRLDALKHIDYDFYKEWLYQVRDGDNLFAVGEYWHGDVKVLLKYLKHVEYSMSLFDVPLHYNFYKCSQHPDTFDMRELYKNTLLERSPMHAVTFVDNHDTQPHQGLASYIDAWFKPFAYAFILLKDAGYPCIFYGDYYGLKYTPYSCFQHTIEKLLYVKKKYGYGKEEEIVDKDQYILTRSNGIVLMMNIRKDNISRIYVGNQFSNNLFYDIFSNNEVMIDHNGYGEFKCHKRQVAVYIKKEN